MDVVLRTSYGEAEISLRSTAKASTLTDLVEHVTGQRCPPIVFVDGRALPATTGLDASGMHYGSTIATSENEQPVDDGVIELMQIAGRGAGESAILPAGHYLLGIGRRASAPELDLAPVDHPSFELTIQSDGAVSIRARSSTVWLNGCRIADGESASWSAGTLDSGDRVFQLLRRGSSSNSSRTRPHARSGHKTTALNRPHRRPQAPPPGPITLQGAANSEARGRRGSALTASWKEILSGHHGAERDRRRSAQPHVGDLVRLAHETDPRLWERRAGDVDAFRVTIGLADVGWSPRLDVTQDLSAKAEAMIAECGPLPMVPVSVELTIERGIAVVGQPDFRSDLARGLILGATVTHGPADLDVVILTSVDRMPGWEWAKWLPHTRVDDAPQVLFEEKEIRSWIKSVHTDSVDAESRDERSEDSTPPHLTIVVVDSSDLWRERESLLRPLFSSNSALLRFIVLADTTEGAPAVCSTVVTGNPDLTASADYIAAGHLVNDIRPFLASADIALSVALDLAPLDDPELPPRTAENMPTQLSLADSLGIGRLDAETFIARWSRADRRPASPVGVSALGPVEINLEDHGPHGLIAGDGADDLLRSLIIGLASDQPPDGLQFALFDYTNGATFGACTQLPHTVWLEPEIDERQAVRVLRCLRAEIGRRAGALQVGNVSDVIDDAQWQDGQFPRLILIVDDADSASAEAPGFLRELAIIARAGQHVGLHLIVAARRPQDSIDSTIKAALDFRIALSMTADESLDLIGTNEAALLPNNLPGRAYARLGMGAKPILFQAAQQGRAPDAATRSVLDICPFVIGRELSPMEHRLTRSPDPADDLGAEPDRAVQPELTEIIDAMSQAAVAAGLADVVRPCPPPLPDRLPMRSFFDEHPGDGVPFALVDLPDDQRQEPSWWRPDLGGFVAIGGAGSGKTSLLVSLALGIAERFSADDVHLYCIDADNGDLDSLSRLPHAGAVTHLDDLDGIVHLIHALGGELDRRRVLADAIDGAPPVAETEPCIVLMVDNIARLQGELESNAAPGSGWPTFERLIKEGQSQGLCLVVTAEAATEVISSIVEATANQVILRLDDPSGYAQLGMERANDNLATGRAHRREDGVELQLVMPPDDVAAAIRDLDAETPHERPPLRKNR